MKHRKRPCRDSFGIFFSLFILHIFFTISILVRESMFTHKKATSFIFLLLSSLPFASLVRVIYLATNGIDTLEFFPLTFKIIKVSFPSSPYFVSTRFLMPKLALDIFVRSEKEIHLQFFNELSFLHTKKSKFAYTHTSHDGSRSFDL